MKVIIIGGLHHNTLGVIRSLGENREEFIDMRVLLIGKKISEKNIISESRYVRKNNIYYVEQDADISKWLVNNVANNNGEKVTVICCSDGSAEQVISNYDRLKRWYNLPSVNYDVSQLMSKDIQDSIALDCGFYVPKGEIVTKGNELDWNIFPCITKPEKSVQGKGKADIHIAFSREELVDCFKRIEAEHVQIQEYLEKSFEYQLIGCSLNCGKTVIIPGYTRIIRQPPNTNTGYLVLSPIEALEYNSEAVKRFLTTIGYNGLFSMEFIRGKDGKDYFLEINMRNDGNAYCVQSAGVNLPFIWCKYNATGIEQDSNINIKKPVYFIPDFLDMKSGIKKEGVFGWIHEFITAKSHSLFNLKDMGPFIYELNRRVDAYIAKRKKMC